MSLHQPATRNLSLRVSEATYAWLAKAAPGEMAVSTFARALLEDAAKRQGDLPSLQPEGYRGPQATRIDFSEVTQAIAELRNELKRIEQEPLRETMRAVHEHGYRERYNWPSSAVKDQAAKDAAVVAVENWERSIG